MSINTKRDIDSSQESTPIYDSVVRDLGWDPRAKDSVKVVTKRAAMRRTPRRRPKSSDGGDDS